MSVRFYTESRSPHARPFFKAGREHTCAAVQGAMRCSVFEIEHYCTKEEHRFCPVYQERMHTEAPVSRETYEVKLVRLEFVQAAC